MHSLSQREFFYKHTIPTWSKMWFLIGRVLLQEPNYILKTRVIEKTTQPLKQVEGFVPLGEHGSCPYRMHDLDSGNLYKS
jgi:hypothetical protein